MPVGSLWRLHLEPLLSSLSVLLGRSEVGLGQLNPAPVVPASKRSCW